MNLAPIPPGDFTGKPISGLIEADVIPSINKRYYFLGLVDLLHCAISTARHVPTNLVLPAPEGIIKRRAAQITGGNFGDQQRGQPSVNVGGFLTVSPLLPVLIWGFR
jgi:hypothetical protein